MAHPGLGLTTAVLVVGNAGCFLDKGPQILGPGLNDSTDHALLNNRVGPMAKPCATEKVSDIPTTATRLVQQVFRRAITR